MPNAQSKHPTFLNHLSGEVIDEQIDPEVWAVLESHHGSKLASDLDTARAAYRREAITSSAPREAMWRTEEHTLPGPGDPLRARLYRPLPGQLPVLLYFHGGGFSKGDLESHDAPLRAIANRVGCLVVAVEYRLAPEHAYPAQVEDAQAALLWLVANAPSLAADPSRVAVGGDCAGGCLAALTALRAREQGGPPLAYQVLLYPLTDLTLGSETQRAFVHGPVLYHGSQVETLGAYLPRHLDRRGAYASPLFAPDLSRLPPALIVTAEFDPLRDDGEAYARRLRGAGVPVTSIRYAAMVHDFLLMSAASEASRRLIDQVSGALRGALGLVQAQGDAGTAERGGGAMLL